MNTSSIAARLRGSFLLALPLAFSLLACQPAAPAEPTVRRESVLDTVVVLSLFGKNAAAAEDRIAKLLHGVDGHVRVQSQDSEAWAVVQGAGKAPVKVSEDTFSIAQLAAELNSLSGGAFDPTIGPISSLWNIESDHPHVATEAELAKLLPLVDASSMVLDPAARTIFLKKPNMRIDFGGVAKGYAAGAAERICAEEGISSGLLNLGNSTIIALGTKPKGAKWRVGIQDPEIVDGVASQDKLLGIVECADSIIESSGTYERFFVKDGKRYHHILNPKTGFPVENGLEQVTLVLPRGYRYADGLSTTVFVLGPQKGMALIESIPGAAAVLATKDKTVLLSSRAADRFHLTNQDYKIVPAR